MKFIKLLRLHQSVKNIFIFAPLFFWGGFTESSLFLQNLMAFFAFTCGASAIYIFNDIQDLSEDRLHPTKKNRPLASRQVSIQSAYWLMLILLITSITLMYSIQLESLFFLTIYLVINLAYSLKLKDIAIIDISIIAVSFVLRLFVGASSAQISLSMWIVLMTFLLALFMALAKRRDDLLILMNTGKEMRPVIKNYNLNFIDSAMIMMSSVVIVSYILYTSSIEVLERLGSDKIYMTSLFVILGMMRYLQITFVKKDSGSPTKIFLKDRFIQICFMAWMLSYAWILYL